MELTLDILTWLLRSLAAILILMTLAPFLRVGWWWVRVLDFPRLQIATLCAGAAIALIPLAIRSEIRPLDLTLLALVAAAGLWQFSHVFRYTRLRDPMLLDADPDAAANTAKLTLLTANLKVSNKQYRLARDAIRNANTDILVLIEADAQWFQALSPIRDTYPHRIEHIAGDGLGLLIWSRLPLAMPEIKRLVSKDRVSMHFSIETPGDLRARMIAIHPAPPGLPKDDAPGLHDSRQRDAELVMVAKAVASNRDQPWIVAGDFNDVAWSHTTRLFERLSGLMDPRVGRGLFNTYHANRRLLRYPLDHVFLSPGMRIANLRRVRIPGSDHFGMALLVQLDANDTPHPNSDNADHNEAGTIVGQARA